MRFSLKLFVLSCVLVALGVSYIGVQSRIRFMRGLSIDRWHSFAGTGRGRGGGIEFDGNGRALAATARSQHEVSLLHEQHDVPAQITSLLIFGADTYQAFDPSKFPNVKELNLAQVALEPTSLKKLHLLPKLTRLGISENSTDLAEALSALQELPRLAHLHVFAGENLSIDDFPTLSQLSLLSIECPSVSPNSQELLRQRLPSCDIVFHIADFGCTPDTVYLACDGTIASNGAAVATLCQMDT